MRGELSFDGRPSGYRDFRRKVILGVAGLEDKIQHLAGPRLLQRLHGEAWRATEHLTVSTLRSTEGWLRVLKALDEHYKYLPETELHEAIDEFMFLLKKRNNEGATAFASRFKTQLSRVQSLIAQERETSRQKRRKKVDEEANPLDDSSVEESGEDGSRSETPDAAAAADTASVPSASPGEREGSVRSGSHRSHRADGAGTAAGSTRSSGRGVRRPREEDEVDPKDAKDDTRMQRLLGTLERSTMRPRPVFPQSVLGHLFMRKFGLSREQRAQVIRATGGSSRFQDVERIMRASDMEDRRPEQRPQLPHKGKREVYAMEYGDDSSELIEPDFEDSDEEVNAVYQDEYDPEEDPEEQEELAEIYAVQQKAKKEFKKSYRTYKESKKKVREIKRARQPYLPVVALQESDPSGPSHGSAKPVFKYDKKPGKGAGKKGADRKPVRKEEAHLAGESFITEFNYMVNTDEMEVLLNSIPIGRAIIDTGCTSSVVGEDTVEALTKHFISQQVPAPQEVSLPPVELKGFNGHTERATKGLKWLVKLGSLWGYITTYVIPGKTPFLLSRKVLQGMEATLDMGNLTITSKKHGMIRVPLQQAANGHLMMPLLDEGLDQSWQPGRDPRQNRREGETLVMDDSNYEPYVEPSDEKIVEPEDQAKLPKYFIRMCRVMMTFNLMQKKMSYKTHCFNKADRQEHFENVCRPVDSPCELSSLSALLALTMSKAKKTFGEFGKLAEDGPLSEEEVIQTAYMINRAVAHKQLPQVTDLLLLKFAKEEFLESMTDACKRRRDPEDDGESLSSWLTLEAVGSRSYHPGATSAPMPSQSAMGYSPASAAAGLQMPHTSDVSIKLPPGVPDVDTWGRTLVKLPKYAKMSWNYEEVVRQSKINTETKRYLGWILRTYGNHSRENSESQAVDLAAYLRRIRWEPEQIGMQSTDSGVALRPMRDLAQQLAAQLRAWQAPELGNPAVAELVGRLPEPGVLDDIAELLRCQACTPYELAYHGLPARLLPLLSSSSEWPWPSASFSPKTLEALVPALQWLLGLCETFPVAAAEGPISGVDCLALAPPRASWASRRMSGVSSALLVCVRATFVDVEELSVKPYKLQRSHSEPALCTQEDVGVESPEVMSMWKINTQQADPIDDQLDSRGNEGSLGHPEVCRRPCVHFAARGCSAGRACSYCHAEHPKRPPSLDKAWRSRLGKLTEGQLLAIVLGQLRARAERKNFLPAAEGLLGILERRWQQLGAELPRLMSEQQSMRRVLSKMTFAGLLSLATSKTNADPFLQEIKVALEQLRREKQVLQSMGKTP
ncbi:unnamed protein product [Effrenium voratum]|uniref:C3H1-type domain-containing protein n=1 Tax=Effrenium voratum TaxID=2562239 RepID=A0AA36JFU5_9DINO|nr:unnamed protein product [Effrenium voratum]